MFTTNPFAELSASVPSGIIQTYVIVMAILVVAGTLFDVIHKGSARYFFESWRRAKSRGSNRSAAVKWCLWRSGRSASKC